MRGEGLVHRSRLPRLPEQPAGVRRRRGDSGDSAARWRAIIAHEASHVEIATAVPAALEGHPAVRRLRLVGSRANGRAHAFSDWDFAVETDDFASVSRDLPHLVAPLRPIAEQWDPFASHACYMLMFSGPTKVDLLFLDQHRDWSPPWSPSPGTLEPIDRHFWDWIVWLEQKRSGGNEAVLATGLTNMFELMLRPIGVATKPRSVAEAVRAYLVARDELERRFGIQVPRELEQAVRPVVMRRQRLVRP